MVPFLLQQHVPVPPILELQVPRKRQTSERLKVKTYVLPNVHSWPLDAFTHLPTVTASFRASQTSFSVGSEEFRILQLKFTLSSLRKGARERYFSLETAIIYLP